MWRIHDLKYKTRLDYLPAISLKDVTAFSARISNAMLTPDVNCKTWKIAWKKEKKGHIRVTCE